VISFNYICSECGKRFEIAAELYVCPRCAQGQEDNQPLSGVLDVELHGAIEGDDIDITKLLPVEKPFFPPLPVGKTPLWKPTVFFKELGFNSLYIKDDGVNPTSSFKDRASFLVSAFAKYNGIDKIVVASTGNAGSSMAGIGAAAGQKVILFLPESAPPAKLIQALQYGATVYPVAGNYDRAYDLSIEYTHAAGGMNRNTAYNPMTIEGKKTVSLELFQQLGKAPDILFVGTGDGCIVAGVYKGFRDLKQLGYIDNIPQIYSVQSDTSDALYRAFHSGRFENLPTHTVADSICVDVPRNGYHALMLLRKYGGEVITVSDDTILASQARLSRSTGLFTEPASAAAFAGFLKIKKDIPHDAIVVILATGNGLKDSPTAAKGVKMPDRSIRTLDDIT
jgi:threonine synthase